VPFHYSLLYGLTHIFTSNLYVGSRADTLRYMQRDIQGIEAASPAAKVSPPASVKPASRAGFGFVTTHLRVIVIVAVLAVAGIFAYLYIDARNQLVRLSDPKLAGQLEGADLVNEIGKSLALPQETPTLATVSDASRLQSQEFFKEAKDGDKVLIFPKAGRALLYRPSTHKIIEYSKVNLGSDVQ
jgi:hypothetical protein